MDLGVGDRLVPDFLPGVVIADLSGLRNNLFKLVEFLFVDDSAALTHISGRELSFNGYFLNLYSNMI